MVQGRSVGSTLRLCASAGRATLTTEPSMKARLDPKIVAARVARGCILKHTLEPYYLRRVPGVARDDCEWRRRAIAPRPHSRTTASAFAAGRAHCARYISSAPSRGERPSNESASTPARRRARAARVPRLPSTFGRCAGNRGRSSRRAAASTWYRDTCSDCPEPFARR